MLLGRICSAAALIICVLSVRSCQSEDNVPPQTSVIELQSKQLTESSGLAVSTRDSNIIWSHNDSGDAPRLFAFESSSGKLKTVLEITDAVAKDWEDICSFQKGGESWLAIGDVGDNSQLRNSVTIYLIKEPKISAATETTIRQRYTSKIEFSYEDGPVNCEALAYDPNADKFLLISKELFRARYYALPRESERPEISIPIARKLQTMIQPMVTAADISRDGKQLIVANYGSGFLLNRTKNNQWDAQRQVNLPLPKRRQGESVCFDTKNRNILVGTEFLPSSVWKVELPESKLKQEH